MQDSYSERKLVTFGDVLKSGDKDEVLKYIKEKNLFNEDEFDPSKILWMLKEDRKFYERVIDIFKKRHYYDMNIWSFAIYHNDN